MLLLIRAIHVGATVLGAGVFAFLFFVARGVWEGAVAADLERWLLRVSGWSAVVAAASWFAWLGLVSASMSGRPLGQALAPDIVGTVLARTTFGSVWTLRLALFALLAGELLSSRRRAREGKHGLRAAGAWLAAGLLMTLAWAGHAVATERPLHLFHLAADAVHLLAAGLWLGALVPLLFVLDCARNSAASGWPAFAVAATQRFSTLGIVAVATLLVTGIINACLLVGSFPALLETPYGRLLSIKTALFGVIVAIAAVNRLRLRPRLLAGGGGEDTSRLALERISRNAIAEICLGAIILLLVGALGTTPPAFHMRAHMQSHLHDVPVPAHSH